MTEENPPQQTITRIKQLRANALLGKKKHFNAAARKERYPSTSAPDIRRQSQPAQAFALR